MSNFKRGDIVEVIDWGREYKTGTNILERMEKDSKTFLFLGNFSDYFLKYAYLNNDHEIEEWRSDTKKYKVLYAYERFVLIQEAGKYDEKVYLIGEEGLQLHDRTFLISTGGDITEDDIIKALNKSGIDGIIVQEGESYNK